MVNTILARRVNHIVAKGDSPAWPKGSKSRGFSNSQIYDLYMNKTFGGEMKIMEKEPWKVTLTKVTRCMINKSWDE